MTRMREPHNSRFSASIQNDKHYLCHQAGGEHEYRWHRQDPVDSLLPLLEVPHPRQTDHNHADHDAINNENPQAIGLKVPNQPGNRSISNDR